MYTIHIIQRSLWKLALWFATVTIAPLMEAKLSLSLVPAPAIKDGRAPVFSLVDHVQPPSNNTAQRLQTLLQCTNRCELDLQECIGVVWLPQDEIPDVFIIPPTMETIAIRHCMFVHGSIIGYTRTYRCNLALFAQVTVVSDNTIRASHTVFSCQMTRNGKAFIITNNSLAGGGVGQCSLLQCITATQPGSARLYLVVVHSHAPSYGITQNVPTPYLYECTQATHIYDVKLNYSAAMDVCAADGGRLIFTRTPSEHSKLNNRLLRSRPHWIGLATLGNTRNFLWLDGSPLVSKTRWGKQQPNNFHPKGVTESQDCVMLHNGVWNDEQCSEEHHFVCQIPFLDI